jgi:hypothetical protein
MTDKWKPILDRLSQPSTYAGFSGLALTLGYTSPQIAAWTNAAATAFSLVAVLLGEAK